MDTTTLDVLAVIFIATLIRSAFGFGEALIAVPLLALRLPLTVASGATCCAGRAGVARIAVSTLRQGSARRVLLGVVPT